MALAKANAGIERLSREAFADINAIFAIEGECASAYFRSWHGLPVSWKGIVRRPVPQEWHAYNWRSSYTDSYSAVVPDGRVIVRPLSFLDFSASYAINDVITLTVDATNLLNEKYQDSFGESGITPRDTRLFDRTFGAGVRVRF